MKINNNRELSIVLKNIIKKHFNNNNSNNHNNNGPLSTKIQKNVNYFKKTYLYLFQFLSIIIFWIMLFQKAISEAILYIIEWKLFQNWISLKDISAIAQQIDMRLQQFCYWPIQYQALLNRKKEYPNIITSYPNYIRFYNNIWLIANDIIIGIIFGTYLIENRHKLIQNINYISNVCTIESLHNMVFWLMNWPAGLKLNSELAGFLGNLFLRLLEIWKGKYLIFPFSLTFQY